MGTSSPSSNRSRILIIDWDRYRLARAAENDRCRLLGHGAEAQDPNW